MEKFMKCGSLLRTVVIYIGVKEQDIVKVFAIKINCSTRTKNKRN
jgi:hypothetical protein